MDYIDTDIGDPQIEISNLRYKYPNCEDWVINSINLSISQGSLSVLLGPTGCGKSTLLKLLRGFSTELKGSIDGQIKINGENILSKDISQLSLYVSLLFQNPKYQLHQLRVFDEVISGPIYQGLQWDDCKSRAHLAITKVGIQSILQKKSLELSTGQQQMVALASSLSLDSNILLLDEPFSYLDTNGIKKLAGFLKELKEDGLTIIVATHNIEAIRNITDRIIIISKGSIFRDLYSFDSLPTNEISNLIGKPMWAKIAEDVDPDLIRKENISSWSSLLSTVNRDSILPYLRSPVKKRSKKCIEVKNISYSYSNKVKALSNLDIDIYEGEIIGFIGKSGSGKTTLAKIILGLIKSDKGEVQIFGKNINNLKPQAKAKIVGYVSQNPSDTLFSESVYKECLFTAETLNLPNAHERVMTILSELGLQHLQTKHPHSLSSGQQRLLSIASVLISDPEIIILDEPEFGLDRKVWENINQILFEYNQRGNTVILISHNLETAYFTCDRLALINEGIIVNIGSPANILTDESLSRIGLNPPTFIEIL